MRRDRHLEARPRDLLLVVEPDDPRPPRARPTLVDAVEVNEADAGARAVARGHAGAEPRGDEREVRVGVARLDEPLRRRQLEAALQPVVLVVGPLGEQRAERLEVRGDAGTDEEARGGRRLEEPGGRVGGPVEAPGIVVEPLALLRGEAAPKIEHVEPRARDDVQRDFQGIATHQGLGGTRSARGAAAASIQGYTRIGRDCVAGPFPATLAYSRDLRPGPRRDGAAHLQEEDR